MGSTADKLTYLNTTKEQLKTKINSLGGSITASTPFRDYVDALDDISGGGGGGTAKIEGPAPADHVSQVHLERFITEIDLDGITINNADHLCNYWEKLTTIKNMTLTSPQSLSSCFSFCLSLVDGPELDTSTCIDFQYMYYWDGSLENVPIMDMSGLTNVRNLQSMFGGCTSLTTTALRNILKTFLTIKTGVYGPSYKRLNYIGLTEAQATTCTSFEEWTTLTARGWTTGY